MLKIFFISCMSILVHSQTDPCLDRQYGIIDNFRRDPNYKSRDSERRLCDNSLVPGWYRFQINGTDAEMPTSCAQVEGCGTRAPLWLSLSSDGLPSPGQQTSGNACATWKLPGRDKQCCGFRIKLQIRNCGEFFIYKLRNTGGCDLAYCAEVPDTFCPTGQIYVRHLQACVDFKVGFTKPVIDVVTINRDVYINCSFDIPNNVIASISPTFHVIWYKGEGITGFTLRSSFRTSNNDALRLGEQVLPGETVTCSVQSVHGQERKVSRPYFLGIKQLNESVLVREDGGVYGLMFISSIPILCRENEFDCKIELLLKIRTAKQGRNPGLLFSRCSLRFRRGEVCEDDICVEQYVTFKLIPNLLNLQSDVLDLRGTIYVDENMIWNQRYLTTTIQYEDLPSGVCFALPGIQMLTFYGRKLQVRRRGTYILLTSVNKELEIHFRVQICEDTQLCICGIVIRYRNSFLILDSCNRDMEENHGHARYTSHFFNGTDGQMKIYEGRSGWLIYVTLEKLARIRLDFGKTGIVFAILLSGYFTGKVDGLCGQMQPAVSEESPADMDTQMWRIRPGASYFDRQTVPSGHTFEEDTNICDCGKVTMDNQCPTPDIDRDPTALVSLTEVTNKWVRESNRTDIPVYIFDGDYDSWPFVNESEASLDKTEAEDQCLKVILTSSITRTCGVYLDEYFEPVLQICTELARYQHNSSWIPVTLRMLESLCEIGIISGGRNGTGAINTSSTTQINVEEIRKVVQCPENCHGNGMCTSDGCRCFPGFYGVDCLKKADSSFSTTTPETYTEPITTPTPERDIPFVSCDLRKSSCSTVNMDLDDTVYTFAVACIIMPIQFSDTGWVPSGNSTNSTLRYISNNVVECMLPDVDYDIRKFPVFRIQVVDGGGYVLSSVLYAVIDSTCQTCRVELGCVLKNGTCFINGDCFEESEDNPDDKCLQCQPDENVWNWSNSPDNRGPRFDTQPTTYAIMENDTLISHISASDPDGDVIQYSVNRQDMNINNNGKFTWRPMIRIRSINGSADMFLVTITDECGLEATLTLTITVYSCECKNNGSCPERIVMSNSSDEYRCRCPDNFIGDRCEAILNPCQSNPCYPGVPCMSNNGGYQCGSCPIGLNGDGTTCVPGCKSYPCFNGTVCTDLNGPIYGHSCGKCPNYFYGDGVECIRTDQNPCTYAVCSPLVTCQEIETYPGYKCGSCPKGYLGNGTQCIAICFPPCEKGNICISPGQCACLPNTDCTDCRSDPCFPGVECSNIQQYPGHKCGPCPKYFQGDGKYCTRAEEDACSDGACASLVKCENIETYPGYTCGACPGGYIKKDNQCIALCDPPCDERNVCISPGRCVCNPVLNCSDCSSDPCFTDVECSNINQYPGHKCGPCPKYFQGDGNYCTRTEEDACSDGACTRLVTCENIEAYPGYTCGTCPDGYIKKDNRCIALCDPQCDERNVCIPPGRCVCDPALNCSDCSTNPCFSGVMCEDIKQYPGYKCGSCPNFFEGDGVKCTRTEESVCIRDVCSRLVTCKEKKTYPGYICSPCPNGYTGNGTNCIAVCNQPCQDDTVCVAPNQCECRPSYSRNCTSMIRDCSSDPCFPGVKCIDERYSSPSFICGLCPRFFHGNGTLCLRTEESACKFNVCSELVTCNDTETYPGYTCGRCPLGYKGDGKTCKAICDNSCRFPRTCVSPGKCGCSPGYGGYNCQTAICCPKCRNRGVCYYSNKCHCRPGYHGFRCEKVICNPPCGPGRLCSAPGVCTCPKGYTGPNCNISLCNPPCQNGGRCVRPNVCSCPTAYCGPQCQYTKCRRKCQNGGVCIAYNRCACVLGYRGRYCQRSRCIPRCRNGGVCDRSGKCHCPYGFYGQYCQKTLCNPPCYNGGVCRRQNVCRCRNGYYGRQCQHVRCRRACYNGGVCVPPNKCRCRSGWGGRQCLKASCPFGCQNGGVCMRPGVCVCKRGYWGNYCQFAACWPRCMYGGVCLSPHSCLCRRRYAGPYCQITIQG